MKEGHFNRVIDSLKIEKIKLVYVGLLLANIKRFYSITNTIPYVELIDDIFSILILGIFIVVIIKQTYTYKQLIVCSIIAFLALYSRFSTGYMIITTSVLTILAIRQEDINEIAAFMLKCKAVCLTIHTILAIGLWSLGLCEIFKMYDEGTRFRINFGFGWPAHFANCILDLILLYVWCHYSKIDWKSLVKMISISIFTFLCTDSKVVFLVSILALLLIGIVRKNNALNKFICLLAKTIVPLATVFMFIMIRLYANGSSIAYAVDSILTTRIRLNGYRLEQYGLTLFGRYCSNDSNGFSPIWISTGGAYDNVYMWLCINMGAIWLILIGLCFMKLAKIDTPILNILLIVWALGAIIDTDYLSGMCSFPILLMTQVFKEKNYKNYSVLKRGSYES